MIWILLIIAWILGFSVLFGPPYVPTLNKQAGIALDLLDLKPGDKIVDFGSGDGAFLRTAAKRGLCGVGYEINPVLWLISVILGWRQRDKIRFVLGSFWGRKLPADIKGAYVFAAGHAMRKLDEQLIRSGHKLRLVSNGFEAPNRPIVKQQGAMVRYDYP